MAGAITPDTARVTDGVANRASARQIWLAGSGAACVAAVVVAGLLLRDVVPPADTWVLDHLYATPGSAGAAFATAASGVGTVLCLVAVGCGAAAVWWRDRGRAGGFLLRALALGLLCGSVLLLQELVMRPGPPQQPQTGTYPSGHATVVTAAAVTTLVLYGRLGRGWRAAALTAGLASVLLVSASRVILAEHWLIDVAAAIVATAGAGLLAATVLRLSPAARSREATT